MENIILLHCVKSYINIFISHGNGIEFLASVELYIPDLYIILMMMAMIVMSSTCYYYHSLYMLLYIHICASSIPFDGSDNSQKKLVYAYAYLYYIYYNHIHYV